MTNTDHDADRRITAADVAIVVPVGGRGLGWDRAACSLSRLDPAPAEVVVVIDGAGETPAATARKIGARVVSLHQRGGPARARNRGAAVSDAAIVAFVDADVEVPVDFVARIIELFAHHQEVAAVIGSYDDDPGHPGFLSQYRNLLHHFVHQTGRDEASTFWSGCGAVRSEVFRAMGGFDEAYENPSVEDIELGSRMRAAGHTIRLVKDLQVKHLKQWRLWDLLLTDLFRRAVPWTRLMLERGEMVNDLNVKTRDRVSVILAFVVLVGLPVALLGPIALAAVAAAALGLAVLNADFLRFLAKRRGLGFAIGGAFMFWLYLLTCGFGFALGIVRHLAGGGIRD